MHKEEELQIYSNTGEQVPMKKLIIFSLLVVASIPILYFGGILPISSHTYYTSPVIHHSELLEKSQLVAIGKIDDSQVQVEFFQHDEMLVPEITTLWTLGIDEMIKGKELTKVQFATGGGKYNNMESTYIDNLGIAIGDELLVFLYKDVDSVWGEDYYIAGIESGIYRIGNDTIKNDYLKKRLI